MTHRKSIPLKNRYTVQGIMNIYLFHSERAGFTDINDYIAYLEGKLEHIDRPGPLEQKSVVAPTGAIQE